MDEQGVEIDLRNTPEQVAAAGTDDSALDYEVVPTAPKYDPETGELIRPLELREDPENAGHPSQIPLAHTTLNYASPELNPNVSAFSPLLSLLMPINLAAMFFVLIAHVILVMGFFSLVLAFVVIIAMGVGLVAHYANVIEEIAIEERDELPRLLRHFDFADDIWLPFCRVCVASVLCFWPGMAVRLAGAIEGWPRDRVKAAHLILDILGLILFPATLLTATTSGSYANLRPDRVLGTIARIGPRYAFFVVLFTVAITVYALGLVAAVTQLNELFVRGPSVEWFLAGLIAYGMLFAGIFLMHYFAWLLGLSYRMEHNSFPWVLQHYERTIPGVTAPRYPMPIPPHPPHGATDKIKAHDSRTPLGRLGLHHRLIVAIKIIIPRQILPVRTGTEEKPTLRIHPNGRMHP